jgi:ribosome biogenesis GTPase A
MEAIARKKAFVHKDKNINLIKASNALLNDYRQGRLGQITLESPESRFLKSIASSKIEN